MDFTGERTKKLTELDRISKEKDGLFIGRYAINPVNGKRIPIYIANFVLYEYGTGAIIAVPAHDERDFQFARKYKIPIKVVINPPDYELNPEKMTRSYMGDGIMVNSQKFNGMNNRDAIPEFAKFFEKHKCGKATVQYKLIDWLISRQRVYGTPLPFWYCLECDEIIPANKDQIPVDPTKKTPPIDKCPKCSSSQIKAAEEVCDCWVDSSITPLVISGYFENEEYFKRAYPSTIRQQGYDIIRTWFFYTVMRCIALTEKPPFNGVLINGLILGPDGFGMSKSRGNVVSPTEHLEEYGADSLRQALLSLTIGSDFPFRWETVKYGRNFLQKYWSASRFASQFLKKFDSSSTPSTLTV